MVQRFVEALADQAMANKSAFIYCNGLGDGKTRVREQLAIRWWKMASLELIHHHVDWYDGATSESRVEELKIHAEQLLKTYGSVALIGSSAGAHLVINTMLDIPDQNVVAISANGRVRVGDYPDAHRMSLFHRAHLDTPKPSQSFFDGVTSLDQMIDSDRISEDQLARILVLKQLTDLVVPAECMELPGATTYRSLAFGHSGGFIAHMFADRDMISKFALGKTIQS